MKGLGKRRSELGRFLDSHGYGQKDLEEASKVSQPTISKVCNDPAYVPSRGIMKKIMAAIKTIKPDAKASDFWDLDI